MFILFLPQALQNELHNKEPELRAILDKAEQTLEQASPLSDVSDLTDKVDAVRGEWAKLKTKASDRQQHLKDVHRHAQKFQADLDTMQMWLNLEEDKLEKADAISLDKPVLSKQLKEAQVGSWCLC